MNITDNGKCELKASWRNGGKTKLTSCLPMDSADPDRADKIAASFMLAINAMLERSGSKHRLRAFDTYAGCDVAVDHGANGGV